MWEVPAFCWGAAHRFLQERLLLTCRWQQVVRAQLFWGDLSPYSCQPWALWKWRHGSGQSWTFFPLWWGAMWRSVSWMTCGTYCGKKWDLGPMDRSLGWDRSGQSLAVDRSFLQYLNYKVEHLRVSCIWELFPFVSMVTEQKKDEDGKINSIPTHKYQPVKKCNKFIWMEK